MFTGIVEGIGSVYRATRGGDRQRLAIDAAAIADGVRVGDSLAVDGTCLTVARTTHRKRLNVLEFDVVGETIARTTLGRLRSGHPVNLERSLRLGDRLGGHLVTGHVDGVGTILSVRDEPGQVRLTVEAPPDLAAGLLPKGSVAVAGVSLTIARVKGRRFSVALVPHTLRATTLGEFRRGDRVNLELDLVGKWVRHLLEEAGSLRRLRRARR